MGSSTCMTIFFSDSLILGMSSEGGNSPMRTMGAANSVLKTDR